MHELILRHASEQPDRTAFTDSGGAVSYGDIPGDHFSVLDEHVATTAEAIRTWLARTVGPGR
ncbi:hypothetical protein [Kitasatospora sp. NPDC059827]|uniref:hypothetical protein n=1 Tax=Kitasatospora sp. NPDC059827 TaxID=3346964 RepID=UPI0036625F25